jgi:Tol biopolymer transport system component
MPRTTLAVLAAAAALLAAVVAPARAASLPADSTLVISGTPDLLSTGTPVADSSLNAVGAFTDSSNQMVAIRPDDHHVLAVFSSRAQLTADASSGGNIYVKDLTNGDVQLASRRSDVDGAPGEPSHVSCSHPVISGNAQVVAFVCFGSLDPADPGDDDQVYARNLKTGVTTLVSRDGAAGPVADNFSENPTIDTAGDVIAFETGATNLGGGVGSGVGNRHVYARQIAGGDALVLVSATNFDQGATPIEGESPSISGDGTLVAFQSADFVNYVPDLVRVFVRRLSPGVNEIVDRASDPPGGFGAIGDGRSSDPVISEDGSRVAFASFAKNLDPAADGDGQVDVYVRTLELSGAAGAGTTKLVDVKGGVKASGGSVPTSIDRTGDVVTFRSPRPNGGNEIYATQPGGGSVLASRGDGAAGAEAEDAERGAVSPDGTLVVFETSRAITSDVDPQFSSVAVRDLANATTRTVSRPPGAAPFVNVGGAAVGGSVSGDGRYVAFASGAFAFGVPLDTLGEVFVRDALTGAVTLVSRADGANGAVLAGSPVGVPRISADGRRVAFALRTVGEPAQVYVRDWQAGRTFVASVPDGPEAVGVIGDRDSLEPSISDDGSRVAFLSSAGNLKDGYVLRVKHVHVRELDANRTVLVDRADGVVGAEADNSADGAVISGDGHAVAFASAAGNLQNGITGFGDDVYLRDIERFTTRLVSVTQDGKGAHSSPDLGVASVSRDGSRVAFTSNSTQLVQPPDTPPADPTLYVKDFAHGGALTLAARADGAAGAIVPVTDSLMSEDGNHVAFTADPAATTIAPDAPADASEVFERDLATGATRLISRASGAGGAPGTGFPGALGGITADGGCVAFAYRGRLLPPPASESFQHVYLRVVVPNCGRATSSTPMPTPPPAAKPAVLSGLSVKPARFFVGARKGGTKIAFRLDRTSSVTLTFSRLLSAHRKGKRCLTTVHKGKRCTVVKVVGRLTVRAGRKGANTVKFSGKLGRRALARGSYRLTATPSRGKARTAKFTVVKAPKAKPSAKPKRHGT